MIGLRQRTRHYIIAGAIGALAMMLISLGIIYYSYTVIEEQKKKEIAEYEEQIKEAQELLKEKEQLKVKVYVPLKDISAGSEIKKEDISAIDVQKDLVPENVVDSKYAIGKYTKIDIKKSTPLVKSMLFEEGILPNDVRNVEFSLIKLPSDLKKDDFVDVRISFPSGEDFIVLSKKNTKKLLGTTVWHEMNEKEILRMSSAIVDAFLHDGNIYSLSYVDPYMQKESKVTYPANQKVLDLMRLDPNIVDLAKIELEARNRSILERNLNEIEESLLMKFRNNQEAVNTKKKNEQLELNMERTQEQSESEQEQTLEEQESFFEDDSSVPYSNND